MKPALLTRYFSLLLLVLVLFAGCRKKEREYMEPVKGIDGSWKIVKALRNGEDMTSRMDFSQFRISFEDSTYHISNLMPFAVSKDGTWSFDDPLYPFEIRFRQQGATDAVVPGFSFPVVKGQRNMILTFSPGCTKNKYEYTLEPETP